MKRVLYITHISWGWIKQRPQFLAEELANYFMVDVFYRKSNRNGSNLNPEFGRENLHVSGFRNYPFERFTFIPPQVSYQVNKLIWHSKTVDISQYDYIWVTDPVLWWQLSKNCKGHIPKLIYDCMDDNSAFPYMDTYPKYKAFYMRMESQLISSADYVICSAKALEKKLIERYGINREYIIVNNAIADLISSYTDRVEGIELPKNSLTYIGTISEWFDFANTLRALNEFSDLNVVLFGPKRMPEIPQHPRLHFMGPTDHRNILAIMQQSSALFMPFIVNDLIKSVNPVKLYEYIYSGKPILASRYNETECFKEFVSLYSDYDEFRCFIIGNVFSSSKRDVLKMQQFAMSNTWNNRAKQILKALGESSICSI